MYHNTLPLRAHLARFGVHQGLLSIACHGVLENVRHFFISCLRMPATTLVWLATARDADITVAVVFFIPLVWSTRGERRLPYFAVVKAALRAKPGPFVPLW